MMDISDKSSRLDIESFLQRQFCLHFQSSDAHLFPYTLDDLLQHEAAMHSVMSQQQELLGHPPSAVVGSLFAKRLSVWGMGVLTCISLFDSRLSLDPAAVRIRLLPEAIMHYHVAWHSESCKLPSDPDKRSEAVEKELAQFVLLTGRTLKSISIWTGTPIHLMWSLLSHNWQTLYLHMTQIEQERSVANVDKINQDLLCLLNSGTGRLLHMRLRRVPARSDQKDHSRPAPAFLRRHCCLAYQLEPDRSEPDYCPTCPKALAADR